MDGVKLNKSKEEVDLGVTITENSTPDRHIDKISGETINLLKRVKMAFSYLDKEIIKKVVDFHDKTNIRICGSSVFPSYKEEYYKIGKSTKSRH